MTWPPDTSDATNVYWYGRCTDQHSASLSTSCAAAMAVAPPGTDTDATDPVAATVTPSLSTSANDTESTVKPGVHTRDHTEGPTRAGEAAMRFITRPTRPTTPRKHQA